MAEKWRVCELAGGAVGNVRACRLPAYVIVAHPSEYRYARCHVGGADGGHSKTYKLKPECDDCPVPALLEAVRARAEVDAHIANCQTCRPADSHGKCDAEYKLTLWAWGKQKAALAALAVLKGEGARDDPVQA